MMPSERWEAYIASVLMDTRVPCAQRVALLSTWLRVLEANPEIAFPSSSRDRETNNLYLSWNPPGKVLDIEIHPSGQTEWFYRDFAKDADDGSDDGDVSGFLRYAKEFSR